MARSTQTAVTKPPLLYTVSLRLAMPLALARLAWKARQDRNYWRHLGERFGLYKQRVEPPSIWLHAVSVGETRAAAPLVRAIQKRWPDHRVLLTHATPTGRATAKKLLGQTVTSVYLPYDTPGGARRFIRKFGPSLGLLMETEVWPNLIATCRRRELPIALINARLSERSAKRYQGIGRWIRPSFEQLDRVLAQSPADAERLRGLGAGNVAVCGNLKFDVLIPAGLDPLIERLRYWSGDRPVLMLASSRSGEEELLLDALQSRWPEELLLLLVPRHPDRFDEVAELLRKRGLTFVRRSEERRLTPQTRVLLGDSMGEMFAYYGLADLACIGGSLAPRGGQNLIEAAAMGLPIVTGPHMFNFADATRCAVESGLAFQEADADGMVLRALELLDDTAQRARIRDIALSWVDQHRGATQRTIDAIAPFLDGAPPTAERPEPGAAPLPAAR